MPNVATPRQRYRFFTATLLVQALLLSGCSGGDDKAAGGNNAGSLSMTLLEDLPIAGGDVTSVAYLDDKTLVAVIDSKLYKLPAAGGAPTLWHDNTAYQSVLVGGHGEVYAFTGEEFWVVDANGGAPRKADLPARTAQTLNTYFSLGPDGQPYMRFLSYPSVIKIYTSADSGVTWTPVALPAAHGYGGGLAFGDTTDEMYLSDPTGFHATRDGGNTWVTSPAAIPNYGPEIVRRKNGDLLCYVPKGGGLRVSHDQGATFSDVSPFNMSPFIQKLIEGEDEALYATIARGASLTSDVPLELVKSSDGGTTWEHIYFAQGHDFARRGKEFAVALAAGGPGGVALSADAGATFVTTGLASVKALSSFGFDKEGQLLIIAGNALFQQRADGWRSLGAPSGAVVATTPQGTIYVPGDLTFVSTDNGASWKAAPLPTRTYGGVGRFNMPVALALQDESLIISRTIYRDDLAANTNGQLVRVTPAGKVTPLTQNGNFVGMLQDASGLLYGWTENFPTAQRSTDSGTTWQEVKTPAPGFAIDGHNRYVKFGESGSFRSGSVGSDSTSLLTLQGFTAQSNQIISSRFDGKDRLHLLTGDGLFVASGSL